MSSKVTAKPYRVEQTAPGCPGYLIGPGMPPGGSRFRLYSDADIARMTADIAFAEGHKSADARLRSALAGLVAAASDESEGRFARTAEALAEARAVIKEGA